MRKFYAFLILFLVVGFSFAQTKTTYTTQASGNYNAGGTWVGGSAPPSTITAGNAIVVSAGHTLTINTAVSIEGTLTNNGAINLGNTLTIETTGVLNHNGLDCAGTPSFLTVNGTVNYNVNGGTIHKDATFNSGSNLNFTGVTNTTPSLTATDAFGNITINCPSMTTNFILPRVSLQNLTITNTGSGSVTTTGDGVTATYSGNLSIGASGKLIFSPSARVTVSGILSNASGTDGLILQSTGTATPAGSIIANQSVNATVQRFIPANSWHLFGAGATGSTTADVIGAYFQYYTESSNTWTYVTATDYALVAGKGYAHYKTSNNTINFTGATYVNDITFSNLSWAGDGNHGWHLLSNPFPSAVRWNNGASWALSNVSGTAKIFNGASWVDRNANAFIASQQGFAIQVTSGTNSITLPKAARYHNNAAFVKEDILGDFISLSLTDDLNLSNDILQLRFIDDASDSYDLQYDSRELPTDGTATEFYIRHNQESLSTVAVASINENRIFELGFKKGDASNLVLTLDEMETETPLELILEDLKTNQFYNLSLGSTLNIVISESDNTHRFNLHVNKANSISEIDATGFKVWISHDFIYINNIKNQNYSYEVYDMSGRLVLSGVDNKSNINKFYLSGSSGVYILKLVSSSEILTQSFIK